MKTKIFIVILFMVAISGIANAGLMEELDAMTPTQAASFREKLEDKANEGTMENLNANIGLFFQSINPKKINNKFSNLKKTDSITGGIFGIRVPVNKDRSLLVGGNFRGAINIASKETSDNVYEDLDMGYGAAEFILEYRFVNTKSFVLSTSGGLGILFGGYTYTKTDENNQTYYQTHRIGIGMASSIALEASWMGDDNWAGGIGAEYFNGKIDNNGRANNNIDKDSPQIDFSGASLKLFARKHF